MLQCSSRKVYLSINVSSAGWAWKGCFLHPFLLKPGFEGQCLIVTIRNGNQIVTEPLKNWIRGWEEVEDPKQGGQKSKKVGKKKEGAIEKTYPNVLWWTCFVLSTEEETKHSLALFSGLCVFDLRILELFGNEVYF